MKTIGRKDMGRFGIRFYAIMGMVYWFGNVRRWIDTHFAYIMTFFESLSVAGR